MAVELDEIRDLADRIAVRLELGRFVMKGPRENIMELESRVAWSTVAGQLHHEGFAMVTPEEYGSLYGISADEVVARIEHEGSLFALFFEGHDEMMVLVPLEERERPDELEPMPR